MKKIVYRIQVDKNFNKKYLKLIKNNDVLRKKIIKTIEQLAKDPFYPSLKSQTVVLPELGKTYSSRVTGDIRIIWNFDSNNALILILIDIGGHSGSKGVY
jgi:mRNA-degrading endonuclease YafQ of YafQ-DinJ toxin-antitoxin module